MQRPTLASQRDYYNRRWEAVSARELNSHELARLEAIRAELDTRLRPDHPRLRILELGCGRGWLSGLVLARHGTVTAVDLSPSSVAKAHASFPGINFVAGDIFKVELDSPFDIVVASEVIEHIPDKWRFVEVMARALKPGGLAILTTPNGRHFDRWMNVTMSRQPVEEWVTRKELSQLLADYFTVSTNRTFFFDAWSGVLNRALNNRLARRIRSAAMVETCLGYVGLGLYIVAVAVRR